jgi:hypothetical protein
MNVGLIGIPGTGKSRLAEGAADKLGEDYDLEIVDAVAEDLSDYLGGIEISHRSSFIPNLMMATEREKRLQHLRANNQDFISCGTLIDSVCYSSAYIGPLAQILEENKSGLLQRQVESEIAAFHAMMYTALRVIGAFDKLFYLPVPKSLEIELPGRPALAPELKQIDTEIQSVLQSLNLPVVTLDGSFDENVERVSKCFLKSSELSAGLSE